MCCSFDSTVDKSPNCRTNISMNESTSYKLPWPLLGLAKSTQMCSNVPYVKLSFKLFGCVIRDWDIMTAQFQTNLDDFL